MKGELLGLGMDMLFRCAARAGTEEELGARARLELSRSVQRSRIASLSGFTTL